MNRYGSWAHDNVSATRFKKGSAEENAEHPLQRLSSLKGAREARQRLVGQSALNPRPFPAQSCMRRARRAISWCGIPSKFLAETSGAKGMGFHEGFPVYIERELVFLLSYTGNK